MDKLIFADFDKICLFYCEKVCLGTDGEKQANLMN